MKINVNAPKPTPPTYDLLGLSEHEFGLIRDMLGSVTGGVPANKSVASHLFHRMEDIVSGFDNRRIDIHNVKIIVR